MGQSGGPAVDPNPPDLRYGRQPLLAGSDCGADAGVARYVTLVALRQRGGRTTRRQCSRAIAPLRFTGSGRFAAQYGQLLAGRIDGTAVDPRRNGWETLLGRIRRHR